MAPFIEKQDWYRPLLHGQEYKLTIDISDSGWVCMYHAITETKPFS